MTDFLSEALKTIAHVAKPSDYEVGAFWSTLSSKDQHIFEVVGVNGNTLQFKEVKTEKKGRYNVPIKGKFLYPHIMLTARKEPYGVSVFDAAARIYYDLLPMRLDEVMNPKPTSERFPKWKIGAIVHVSWGATMQRNRFYEVVERSGVSVTLRRRNQKEVETYGYDNGTETIDKGFATPETIKVRILSTPSQKDGLVKLGYGMFGYLWDGKPVSFYGD